MAWADVVSLAIGLVQTCLWEGGECLARTNTHVDDPLTVVRGTVTRRNQLVACLVSSSQPWGFRFRFERATGEQVSTGSA